MIPADSNANDIFPWPHAGVEIYNQREMSDFSTYKKLKLFENLTS